MPKRQILEVAHMSPYNVHHISIKMVERHEDRDCEVYFNMSDLSIGQGGTLKIKWYYVAFIDSRVKMSAHYYGFCHKTNSNL